MKCKHCGNEVNESRGVCPACEYPLHVSENFDIQNGVLVKYKGNAENVIIPNSIISIGDRAFKDCYYIKTITIPDSVTSIGYDAFWGCESLTSIIIPDGVASIVDYAFRGCKSLSSVTIPNSVTYIADWAFNSCALRMVSVSRNCEVAENAFDYGCEVIRR